MAFDPFDQANRARAQQFFAVQGAGGAPLQDAGTPWGPGGPLNLPTQPVVPVINPPPEPVATPGAPQPQTPKPAADAPQAGTVAQPPQPGSATTATPVGPIAAHGSGLSTDRFGVKSATSELMATYDQQKQATLAEANAQQVKDLATAEGLDAADTEREGQVAEQQAIERQHAAEYEQKMNELGAERQKIAEMKVDPTKLMKSNGALAAVGILGSALGGFFQGFTGGKSNQVLDMFREQVDKDIAEQQRQIGEAKDKNAGDMNALGALKAKWQDDRVASLQLKNLMYESAKNHVMNKAAELDSPVVQARADGLVAGLEQERAKVKRALAVEMQKQAAAAAAHQAAAAAARRKEAMDLYKWKQEFNLKAAEAGMKGQEKADKDAARFVATGQDKDGNPTGFLARSPEDAAKKETILTSGTDILNNIDRALKIRQETGPVMRTLNREGALGMWTPEWQTRLRSISTGLTLSLKNLEQAGALDKGMQEIAGSIIGDLESRGSTSDERLREFRDRVEARIDATKRGAAGQIAAKATDEAGNERVQRARSYYAPAPALPDTVRRK